MFITTSALVILALGIDLTSVSGEQVQADVRQGVKDSEGKWPNGKVPYTISNSGFNSFVEKKVKRAIASWNRRVKCPKFIPWKAEKDYINIVMGGDECSVDLGRSGGEQTLSYSTQACPSNPTVLQLLSRAVGLGYEMDRPDRDKFVKVLFQNIPPKYKDYYKKDSRQDVNVIGNYDFYSARHFPMTSTKPAFKILKKGIDPKKIGKATVFTNRDLKKLQQIYKNCPSR